MAIRRHGAALAAFAAVAVGMLGPGCSRAAAGGTGKEWPPWPAGTADAWSGVYIGAGLGGARGDAGFVFAGGLPANPNPMDFDGKLAGGFHLGVQRQWGKVVVGLETSLMLADLGGTAICPNPTFSCSVDLDWIWMVGPRLGVAAGSLHLYGTGGYALGSMSSRTVTIATGAQFDTGQDRHDGWYLGGGIEWNLGRAVILGVEYKRIEFDADSHASSSGIAAGDRTVDGTIDTVQARLTLKLGDLIK